MRYLEENRFVQAREYQVRFIVANLFIIKLIAPIKQSFVTPSRCQETLSRVKRAVMSQHYYSLRERITRKKDARKKINGKHVKDLVISVDLLGALA